MSVNGIPIEVLSTDEANFANFIFDADQGLAEVTIERRHDTIDAVTIRPQRLGIGFEIEVKTLRFTLKSAEKLSIEIEGETPLFLWANPPETDKPSPEDPNVRFFKSGQIYELGCFSIKPNQTLYIEGGAVVKGRLLTKDTDDITIRGYGIFDGSYYLRKDGHMLPSIAFDHCREVTLRDITMIHPSGWMLLLGSCDHVEIENLKQIGEVVCSDGIDVVGSRDVHIHHCFLRNNDDCVVVKAFHVAEKNLTDTNIDGARSPERILVEHCTFLNNRAGNAMEIGHELAVDTVRNVTFREIDVCSVHGHGAVFSLHNNDRAHISRVLFENIRIEHCWDKFIDFRISRSRFSTDDTRGRISGVLLRNIHWKRAHVNEGYTISLIGGWGPQ
ncbi:MAG: glycosyl hydrolase family 28 protein, partial [Verrucomicrobiales bacterium]